MMKLTKAIMVVSFFALVCSCVPDGNTKGDGTSKNDSYTADLSFDSATKAVKQGEANSIIYGEVSNVTENYIFFFCDSYIDTVEVKPNGSFEFELPILTPQYARLVYDSKGINIFISPNDSLQISFDSKDIFNSISFMGRGSVANQYLKGKHLLMFDLSIPLGDLYSYPPAKFKRTVDSAYVVQKIFLDESLNSESDIPEEFKEMEFAAIQYERATKLFEYTLQSNYYSELGDDYFNFVSKLSVNESTLLRQYDYRTFLNSYIDYYSYDYLMKNSKHDYSPLEYTIAKMDKIVELIESNEVKDYMMFNLLKSHVKYYGFKNTEELFYIFKKECTNSDLRKRAMDPFNKYMKLKQSPKAELVQFLDIGGAEYNWDSFTGKYIYVDVWATWCGPCKEESVVFQELAHKYSSKNIEFVSLSIDSNMDKWKGAVGGKSELNHFILKESKRFLSTYQVKTVPHFLIIDEYGNLIDSDADRPSEIDESFFEELPDKEAV